MGVPVIGTNVGGLPEVVEHGRNGFLGAVGDVEAMAHGAVELLTDPDRYRAWSSAARARAEQFATAKVVPLYEELYAAVVAG